MRRLRFRTLRPVEKETGWAPGQNAMKNAYALVDEADCVHFAPDCQVWSRTRTIPSRAQRKRDQAEQRTVIKMVAALCRRVQRAGHGPPVSMFSAGRRPRYAAFSPAAPAAGGRWSLEHPQSSKAWKEGAWQSLLRDVGVSSVVLDQCRFGAHIEKGPETGKLVKKPTRIAANFDVSALGYSAAYGSRTWDMDPSGHFITIVAGACAAAEEARAGSKEAAAEAEGARARGAEAEAEAARHRGDAEARAGRHAELEGELEAASRDRDESAARAAGLEGELAAARERADGDRRALEER
eukprot:gene29552-53616_t